MTEPVRALPATSPAQRKRSVDLLVRRATTASMGAAIFLTGAFALVASLGGVSAQSVPLSSAAGDTTSALAKALADYQAAAGRRQSAVVTPKPVQPIAAPRRAPAAASHPAAAVSGGS